MDSSHVPLPNQSSLGPPRIFGNYPLDGSTQRPSYSGAMFTDEFGDYGGLDMNDSADAKRRRIARACDLCRRRKIKCDGKSPCAHCQNYNTECVYHFEQKARKPAKTAKYIEGLENRLARMEHLLRLSGLLGEDEEGRTDLGALEQRLAHRMSSDHNSPSNHSDQMNSSSHRRTNHGTPARGHSPSSRSPSTPPRIPKHEDESTGDRHDKDNSNPVDDLANMMDSLVTNNQGETRYIGSSSGFSIFSPKGVEWVSAKTGDSSFQDMIKSISVDDNKWYHWKPEVFGDIFARTTFKQLPPREECLSLMTDFFENFNNMFPLFHEPTFMHLVDRQYSNQPYEGSGWWASLNVALAIAWRIRIVKDFIPARDEPSDWAYFKNALAVLSELTLRNTDLFSVQALLGMCLFLQGTPNPQPSFFLLGAAMRLAHSIGLHKRGSGHGFNVLEDEQRRRVFWIAYLCDKDICLRSGRPPAQDDQDWNVELPEEDPADGVGGVPLPDGSGKRCNLFRKMCEFSVISSKVYNRLYSVKASKQSDGELLNTIGELDQALEEWKESIPLCFRPDHEIDSSQPQLMLHLAVLHFAYYNCLATIHRRSILHGYWSDRLAQFAIEGRNARPLNHRVFSSAALCVSAARMSVSLLKYIPPGDYACVWLVLYYPVSALVTLFLNILQNPQDSRARPDLKLMDGVVKFLAHIRAEETTGSIEHMYSVCSEFERIARVVLEKAEKEMSTRQKRKQERDREKLQKTTLEQEQKATASAARNNLLATEGLFTGGPLQAARSGSGSSNAFETPYMNESMQPMANGYDPNAFTGFSQNQTFDPLLNDPLVMGNGNDLNNFALFGNNDMDASATAAINNVGMFQQPFHPQDMWSMPMTFEWDWADMTNMPSF